MNKIFKQKLIAIALGVLVAVFASYVGAMSRPFSISTNPDTFINVGPVTGISNDQVKDGQLNTIGLMIGNFSSGAYTTINSIGHMVVSGSSITGSALSIDNSSSILGNALLGSLRSTDLIWNNTGTTRDHTVCADADGKLIICSINGNREYGQGGAGHGTLYDTFIVPNGVHSITAQVFAGGGAGYGSKNTEGTGFDDGDDSYLIGDGVSLIALGGRGAYGQANGGAPGASSASGAVNVTTTTGQAGSTPTHNTSLTNSTQHMNGPITCGPKSFYPIVGGQGDIGGSGGKAGSGSQASGGTSGPRGPLSRQDYPPDSNYNSWTFITTAACSFQNLTSDILTTTYIPATIAYHRPGGNGEDGVKGGGGGGYGGRGGASAFIENSLTCAQALTGTGNDTAFDCEGGLAASGGGGGGYAQGTISVTPGQVFYLKIGGGGNPQTNSCTGTNCTLKQLGGGATSGKGGDGYIKITY